MVKARMVPRGARTGGRRGGLALLRAERDHALGVVDRHRELVEEVAAEQGVPPRPAAGPAGPCPSPVAPFLAPAAVPGVSEMPAAAMTRGATTVRSAPVSSMRRADVEPFSRASTRMRWPGVTLIAAPPVAAGPPPAGAPAAGAGAGGSLRIGSATAFARKRSGTL